MRKNPKYSGLQPVINNIKFRFTISYDNIPALIKSLQKRFRVRTYGNFAVLRTPQATYTIYYSKCINVTGISKFTLIPQAIKTFCTIIKISRITSSITIDNITANGRFQQAVPLFKLCHAINLKTSLQCTPSFDPTYFPGAVIRSNRGTIIVFGTGSYVVVGCKTQLEINTLFHNIFALIKKL
jgi:TATA-box binding protein (TBP) (component of TFIID and TFIIIB)